MTVKETLADLVISLEYLLRRTTMEEMGMRMTERKMKKILLQQ
jgi:hypothetical protein